jgi:hypothetical protein
MWRRDVAEVLRSRRRHGPGVNRSGLAGRGLTAAALEKAIECALRLPRQWPSKLPSSTVQCGGIGMTDRQALSTLSPMRRGDIVPLPTPALVSRAASLDSKARCPPPLDAYNDLRANDRSSTQDGPDRRARNLSHPISCEADATRRGQCRRAQADACQGWDV